MSINAYINDASLVGQFQPGTSRGAIDNVTAMVRLLRKCPNCTLYWNRSALFGALVEPDKTFGHVLEGKRDLQLYWQNLRCQLVESTIQAAVDDTIKEQAAGLVCYIMSSFSEPTTVCGTPPTEVRVFLGEESLSSFLYANHYLSDYTADTHYSPRDEQTILVDTNLFEPTQRDNHGRRLYLRKGTDQLWCVDNFHVGLDAELEVFRISDEAHIGTCGINDIHTFDSKAKKGRYVEGYWSK